MQVARTVSEVRRAVAEARGAGRTIHCVPTMGALHEGHLSLIRAACGAKRFVVVTVFVNPTQFAPGEDFERYPRPLEADLEACRRERVDLVFAPSPEEMYPPGFNTFVHVEGLTEVLCGAHRPGHFDGVTTVVAKLFGVVQPDVAYFGQKDAQQAAIVRRMTCDLNLPVEIVVCPIVRDADGVALSSRNAYLSPQEREQARSLSGALALGEEMIRKGQRSAVEIARAMREHIMVAGPCRIDYVEIVDPDTLQPIEHLGTRCLLAVAVRIGWTRLIDNRRVDLADAGG